MIDAAGLPNPILQYLVPRLHTQIQLYFPLVLKGQEGQKPCSLTSSDNLTLPREDLCLQRLLLTSNLTLRCKRYFKNQLVIWKWIFFLGL